MYKKSNVLKIGPKKGINQRLRVPNHECIRDLVGRTNIKLSKLPR